jgi:hypothetical protein
MNNLPPKLGNDDNKTRLPSWLILVVFTFLAFLGYLATSFYKYGVGFPLDDAWIHQTYARNLAATGLWAYVPGKVSAGSTSPLWTILISSGALIKSTPYLWTYLLGGFSLWSLAILGNKIWRITDQEVKNPYPLIGILLAGEWHLVWSAASGMETILYAATILLVFVLLSQSTIKWMRVGTVISLSVWLRPDGMTLLGPALFLLILNRTEIKRKMFNLFRLLIGFLTGFIPYLEFNHIMLGSWMPNTFYAKQAEYEILTQTPYFERYFKLLLIPFIGVGALLLPGLLYFLVNAVRNKNPKIFAFVLWFLGYIGIYAFSLPVSYQYGRYIIPAMPIIFIFGGVGMKQLFEKYRKKSRFFWRLSIFGALVATGVWFGFYGIGANAYARDVGIIETEMVACAKWISNNTPQNSIIAAHDIGALGYFGKRQIIDLAGLISPDVIPFIRDEQQLKNYLDQKEVDYLMTFPGWYAYLTSKRDKIFQTDGKVSPASGGENMAIYEWRTK